MEARYALRKRQLLDECQMDPEIFSRSCHASTPS